MPVVLKLGGSLLDRPELAEELAQLVSRLGPRVAVLAGGGPLADVVRDWHGPHRLTEPAAHRLAMRTLDVTAELIARLLPHAVLCSSVGDVHRVWQWERPAVVLPAAWFETESGWFAGQPRLSVGLLPETWDVTSDTLAACVAVDLQAELWLLKSVDWPADVALPEAARRRLLDDAFPRVAPLVPEIRWLNLRSGAQTPVALPRE